MTVDVVTVTPDTSVADIADLLLDKKISGVPVVDQGGAILGIVTEGDLIRRQADDGPAHRQSSWWLRLVKDAEDTAANYIKTHGLCAGDIMTRSVITVDADTPAGDIARILADNRIKRVPVVQNGALVGIVSRSNLLRGLASRERSRKTSAGELSVKESILETVRHQGWVTHGTLNVIVTAGVVEMWGWVESEEERRALLLIARSAAGTRTVEDHLGAIPPYLQSD